MLIHQSEKQYVESIYGWVVFPEVLKCVLNHTSDLSCKYSYLLQVDTSISNDLRCS